MPLSFQTTCPAERDNPRPACRRSVSYRMVTFLTAVLLGLNLSVPACDLSYFELDSLTFDGVHFTAHTTLCIGGGAVGTTAGAGGFTSRFAIAAYGTKGSIVGFTPDSLTNYHTGCSVVGSLMPNQPFPANIGGTGDVANSMVEFQPPTNCEFICASSLVNCGPPQSFCFRIQIQMSGLPDSLMAIGVEGFGSYQFGCHRGSHGTFATNDMSISLAGLPVEWGSFEALKRNGGVQLEWQTLSEDGNDFFRVLRSEDALNWESIGVVDADGDTEHVRKYGFFDAHPAIGTNHYRIVQVDIEGSQSATEVVSVNIPLPAGLSLETVGPVPATDQLRLELVSDRKRDVQVDVIALNGQVARTQSVPLQVGTNPLEIKVGTLPRG